MDSRKSQNPNGIPVPQFPPRTLDPNTDLKAILATMEARISTLQAQVGLLQQQIATKDMLLEEQSQRLVDQAQKLEDQAQKLEDSQRKIEALSTKLSEDLSEYESDNMDYSEESETEVTGQSSVKRKLPENYNEQFPVIKQKRKTRSKGIMAKEDQTNKKDPTDHQEASSESPGIPATQKEPTTSQAANNAQTKDTTTDQNKTKKIRIPPIVIHDKGKVWKTVRDWMNSEKVNFTHATNVKDGIQIITSTAEDYRKLQKHVQTHNYSAHTYPLPEEKQLRVVIRGIPSEIEDKEVEEELKLLQFTPSLVVRMKKKGGNPMPLVLVSLPKDQNQIYKLEALLDIRIKVEALKARARINQCHGCQRFGHGQTRCSAPHRCVKCAGSHHTSECKKPKTTPAKCANCGGDHPANYSQCPKRPKTRTATITAASPPTRPAWQDPSKQLFKKPEQTRNSETTQNSQNIFEAMNALQTFLTSFQDQMQKAFIPLVQAISNSNQGR